MKYLTLFLIIIFNLISAPADYIDYSAINVFNAYVNDGSTSLDFSEIKPHLNDLTLYSCRGSSLDVVYLASDDAGLSKNVYLKKLVAFSDYVQAPIAKSYLPNVEYYKLFLGVPLYDFDYLHRSLPSLKTVDISSALDPSFRERLAIRLENISKLSLLENLTINSYEKEWPIHAFTDEELIALSKMHNLKKLNLEITYFNEFEKHKFDSEQRKLLATFLPNTQINIHFNCHYPSDD